MDPVLRSRRGTWTGWAGAPDAGQEELVRALGSDHRLAFLLHIPFPSLQLLERMPWAEELVEALCHFDLLGFQTKGSRANFLDAARHLVPDAFSHGSVDAHPFFQGRAIRTGAFPISIDVTEYSAAARGPVVMAMEREIRRELGGRTLILGVDRLDYSKGIPEKLRGFDLALEKHPELRGSVLLKQLVVPSRDQIPTYRETKREIERLVRSINERWGTDAWRPVEYLYDSWSRSASQPSCTVTTSGVGGSRGD